MNDNVANVQPAAEEIVLTPKNFNQSHYLKDTPEDGVGKMEEEYNNDDNVPHLNNHRPWRRKLYLFLLLLSTFLSYCNMSVMAPFYPPETWKRGISETTTGLVFSFYSFIMFAMSPFYGIIIPKIGVKNTFIWGYLFAGISNVCFGALGYIEDATLFVVLSFLIRGAEGLGTCAAENAAFVFISQLYPNDSNFARGLFETAVGLGFSSGPAVGGFLYSLGGFGLPFYALGGLIVLNDLLNAKILPKLEDSTAPAPNGSLKGLIKLKQTIVCVLIIITTSMIMATYTTTLEPHLRKFQLKPEVLGAVFLVDTATYTIFTPLWGRLIDKMTTSWWLMPLGLLVQGVFLLFLGPSSFITFIEDSIWLNIIVLAGVGLFDGLVIIPSYKAIVDGALANGFEDDKTLHSFVTSTWMCSYALGQVIGPAMGGVLLEHWSFEALSSCLVIVSIVMSFVSFISYMCWQFYL